MSKLKDNLRVFVFVVFYNYKRGNVAKQKNIFQNIHDFITIFREERRRRSRKNINK